MAVLGLYRRLMRLHQRLPDSDMAELGRQFAREEFRQHKSADAKFAASFVEEWTVSGGRYLLNVLSVLYIIALCRSIRRTTEKFRDKGRG